MSGRTGARPTHPVVSAHIVPGQPHVLLAPERSPA